MINVNKLRSEFPILSREVNGKQLVYLDNGASSQKPQVVLMLFRMHIQTSIPMFIEDSIIFQI